MGMGKPVIWLMEGHVCGFTLPLPVNVMERWKSGHLIRVNEDGSTFQGPHYVLPDGSAAAEVEAPADDAVSDLHVPVRPKKNASRVEWAAYAIALGATTGDAADGMSRDELIDLTTPPEEKASGS
jgi:hypothetical protein